MHRAAAARRPAPASRAAAISPGVSRGTSNAGCVAAHARSTSALQQELQVDQAALALLEVEARRIAAIQFGAHAPAHRDHVGAQRRGIARARQRFAAHALEIGAAAHASPATQRARTSAWCSQVHARSRW